MDRRKFVLSAGVGAAALTAAKPSTTKGGVINSSSGGMFSERKLDPDGGPSVVLLGTGTPLPNPDRACSSAMVIAGERRVLVDAGRGCVERMFGKGLTDAELTLFTHYHSDHFAGFGEFMVTRTIRGSKGKMPVIGPEGAKRVIGGMMDVYSIDDAYREDHHGDKWDDEAMKADITEADSGVVYNEDGLKITMFEVDHSPVRPAVGYRFDYRGKSIVISGDTKKVPQMAKMAKGCDVLVHEAVNRSIIERFQGMAGTMDERLDAMTTEMLEYHTDVIEAAEIAKEAGAKKLVLTHMVPSIPPNRVAEMLFTRGMRKVYKGPIKVGRDTMEIKA